MDNKMRKIIAREGLIILGIITIGFFIIALSSRFPAPNLSPQAVKAFDEQNSARIKRNVQRMISLSAPESEIIEYIELEGINPKEVGFTLTQQNSFHEFKRKQPVDLIWDSVNEKRIKIKQFGSGILIFSYPFYLLVMFFIWAIRTLKQK